MKRTTKKARRGREEGSIFQRTDGRWASEISLGYDGNGKRIRKTVYGADKGEVAEKLRKLQADNDAGRLVETEQLTTGEYLTRWLDNTAKNLVGLQTWERYRQLVELHLVPILGRVKLSKLAPLHVEQCYATMAKATEKRKSASASTRKSAGVILSVALRHAVRIKLIPHNPAADVAKARPSEREMQFMSQHQARLFLDGANGQQLLTLFITAFGTGARQGELLGLQWPDVDFEKGSLEIRRSLAWVKKEPILKEPKSKAGKRTIALPAFVLSALREHRAAALKAGLIASPVFCTRTGKHLDKKNVLRSFRNVVKKVNAATQKQATNTNLEPCLIPEMIRFHDIRHTHASQLIANGHSIKAVSRRLGHSCIDVTLRVYAHLMPDDDAKLATGVELLFG
ncbi:MAG TPA: tyrosine-type recombinase/integrase [Gemmata sp.]|nr:tyrosine-type recombinase/integrase [Gemmata sp.]